MKKIPVLVFLILLSACSSTNTDNTHKDKQLTVKKEGESLNITPRDAAAIGSVSAALLGLLILL